MVVPTPPGTRRRGMRRHGAGVPCPNPTRARRLDTETGPRFQDKISLPLSSVAQQTGWSVPGRTMPRFSPQPPRPAPRGSSTEGMAVWGWGSHRAVEGAGSTGAAETSRRPLTLGLTCQGQPPPTLAVPWPQGCHPTSNSLFGSQALSTQQCPAPDGRALLAFCQEGPFGTMDFSRWDLLGMMDFSRRMSPSELVAGLGGSRARASPCAQGTRGLWKPGFLVAAGYASRLECSRQGQLLFPETGLTGFGAGCSQCWRQERPLPQPSRELAAGESRNVSERGKKKKNKPTHPSPAPLKKKYHFCYNLSFMRAFCSN